MNQPNKYQESPFATLEGINHPAQDRMKSFSQSREFSIRDIKKYIIIFQRKWYLIALTVTLGATAAYFSLKSAIPIYRAASTFELFMYQQVRTHEGVFIEGRGLNDESRETFLEKMKSPKIKKRAEEIVRGDRRFSNLANHELYDLFSHRISQIRGSRIMSVTINHAKPSLAQAFANAYVEAIRRISLEEKRQVIDASVRDLNEEYQVMIEDLENMDDSIRRLRKASFLDDLVSEQNSLQGEKNNISTKLLELESQGALLEEIISYLTITELSVKNLEQLPASVSQIPDIQNALATLEESERQLTALLIRYKGKHPRVKEQQEIIDINRERLKYTTQQALRTKETDLNFINTQKENLKLKQNLIQKKLNELKLNILKINQQIGTEERKRSVIEMKLQQHYNLIGDAKLRADKSATTIAPLEKAALPTTPITPGSTKVLQKYMIFGLVAGLLLAVGSNKLDDFVWSPEDVEQSVGVRVLALLPRMKLRDRSQLAKVCTTKKSNLFTEVFTGLRGVLTSGENKKSYSSLLVTSCSPQEGKTICSTNLAIMYALGGTKTLLIDFDTRIPRIHRIFGFTENETPNLLSVLSEKKSDEFSTLPLKTDVANLDVICSFADDSFIHAELMGSSFLAEFIQWTKRNYEQVIIDSPPFGAVSDSNIIGGMVDGVILVVGQKRSRKTTLMRATQQFRDYGANVVGIIMNGIKQKGSKYSYYYGYGYGGYSYSYTGNYGTSRNKKKTDKPANTS